MRYGMNPHQVAEVVGDVGAVSVVGGEPSLINYLDALNGWQLVAEASRAANRPAAASFKHVSPAGVATAGEVDVTAGEARAVAAGMDALTSAYLRAGTRTRSRRSETRLPYLIQSPMILRSS